MNYTSKPKPPAALRWTVLVLVSLAMFGNYYVYDSISPVADLLKAQLGFSDSQIGTLNAIYSIPNVVMVLIGGVIIDTIGTRLATLIFAGLCFLGAAVTVSIPEFVPMAAGRLIFGLGAESLIVAVTTAIAKWFRGKELSFAFGLNLTIARLGSFAALNSPTWARTLYATWRGPLFVALIMALVSVVAGFVYFASERSAEQRYELLQGASTDKVVFSDLWNFGRSYWFVVALCFTFYSAVFPFQTFAIKYFQEAHGVSRETAGFLSSMLTLFAMVFTPLFGLLADKIGKRSLLMMFGSVLLLPAYLWMAVGQVNLYVPMALIGIAFSLVPAVMWPSVAYLVDQQKLGTAYGLMTMLQNIGLAAFNLGVGALNDFFGASKDHPQGYVPGLLVFAALGLLGFLFAYLLRRAEHGPQARGLELANPAQSS